MGRVLLRKLVERMAFVEFDVVKLAEILISSCIFNPTEILYYIYCTLLLLYVCDDSTSYIRVMLLCQCALF